MLDFTRSLTPASVPGMLAWKAAGRRWTARVRPRACPGPVELRPDRMDYGVAYEVWVHDFYAPAAARLDPAAVRLIVDVGANVGFAALRLLHAFPAARVLAYEPHPHHAAQARRNLRLAGAAHRVELVEAAAGARARAAVLSDEGACSTAADAGAGMPVRFVDLFAELAGRRVNLLKLDCEGGEYELLEDARFDALDVGAVAMEWHRIPGRPDGARWCLDRLRALGWAPEAYATEEHAGMIFAPPRGAMAA